jgi:N-acetyl-gamma-glutamyl-phosphate/LysW-gamma-L-alpha-aminoadipyl-6-phosphate reductase
MRDLSVAIVGASGYSGGELLRLLLFHPEVGHIQATSQRLAGRRATDAHPNLRGVTDLRFVDVAAVEPCDVVFSCLPHGESMARIDQLTALAPRLVDLGGDFRLKDPEAYARANGRPHLRPELLPRFVYGIPELHRAEMVAADRVSSAGCNATAVILALHPLYAAGLVDAARTVVEVKAGTSQGGNAPDVGSHHPERHGSLRCYRPVGHRHGAEIRQELGLGPDGPLHFTATSLPIVRGVQAVCHVFLRDPAIDERALLRVYAKAYGDEPFVRLVHGQSGPHRMPDPRPLAGTNWCDVGFARDPESDRVVVVSAIDNLGKGAAGQAVQAFNLMTGSPETAGLAFPGLHPA